MPYGANPYLRRSPAAPVAATAPSAPPVARMHAAEHQPKEAYRQSEIETLTPRDLVVKLYEGAERFLRQGADAIRAQPMQIEAVHNNCVRANAIFTELLSTLNFEAGGAIAVQLRDLYLFLLREITESNMRKDADRLERLLPIVGTLRSAWENIPAEHATVSSIPDTQRGHALDLRT